MIAFSNACKTSLILLIYSVISWQINALICIIVLYVHLLPIRIVTQAYNSIHIITSISVYSHSCSIRFALNSNNTHTKLISILSRLRSYIGFEFILVFFCSGKFRIVEKERKMEISLDDAHSFRRFLMYRLEQSMKFVGAFSSSYFEIHFYFISPNWFFIYFDEKCLENIQNESKCQNTLEIKSWK